MGIAKIWKDQSGNVLPFFAAAIFPMIGLVGGAMDMSMVYMARSKLQKACDAGVLAGRQAMNSTTFTTANEAEADKFFDFNYPSGLFNAKDLKFDVTQSATTKTELLGTASAKIPTNLMRVFGFQEMSVDVKCNAKKDLGHNDIMLVLDVTGSMNDKSTAVVAAGGTTTKIDALRTGALGLYRAMENAEGSVTRYGFMPYSHTVNVARSLSNNDILNNQDYIQQSCGWWSCSYSLKTVSASDSTWGSKSAFRTSGDGCIEERTSNSSSGSSISISQTITKNDIELRSTGSNNTSRQFGRYDPAVQESESQSGCPSEAIKLQEYADLDAYQKDLNKATARVTGGTYHDIGITWGARFLSRNGFYKSENPDKIGIVPVNQHLIFMTDGILDTGDTLYSAYGIARRQDRISGSEGLTTKHVNRFKSACSLAKSMNMTIWVIALDVTSVDDIKGCATSPAHFKTSDGTDLEAVFEEIGRGIGNLRLTK